MVHGEEDFVNNDQTLKNQSVTRKMLWMLFVLTLLVTTYCVTSVHIAKGAEPQQCGVRINHFVDVVVGGQATSEFDWPWLVAIYVLNDRHSLEFRCGGTLVSNDVVITAAHCFVRDNQLAPARDIVVSLGRHNLRQWGEADTSVNRMVKRLIIHDTYRPEIKLNKDGDLAALVLESKVQFSAKIQPVCLLSEDMTTEAGVIGSVPGWGFAFKNVDPLPETPQVIEGDIILHDECLQSDPRFQGLLTRNTFCAKALTAGSGPCSGDSGGGFYVAQHEVNPQRSIWFLQGIVFRVLKLNDECDFTRNFIVLDMAVYNPWIRSVVINKSPPPKGTGMWSSKPSGMWAASTKSPIWESCKKARNLPLEKLHEHAYYFSDNQPAMNWTDAQNFCRSNGMELASIESEAEWNALIPGVRRLQAKFHWAWVSGSDAEVEGQWKWTSTGDKVSFSKFDPECSRGQKTEEANCMYVWPDGWCDYPCSGKTAFICEIDSMC